MPRPLRGLLAISVVVALVVGCGTAVSSATSRVVVRDAWARATVSAQSTGAVYFTLTAGSTADVLTAASVPGSISDGAELHQTMTMDDGGGSGTSDEMDMQSLGSLAIGPHITVKFQPGGYHVMLTHLKHRLAPGERFDLTLTFTHAGDVTVPIKVRG